MSIDKDSSGLETAAAVDRPPAVSAHLWDVIPHEERRLFLVAAAKGLRRGIHPETTVKEMLEKRGWAPDELYIVSNSGTYHPDDRDGYDPFYEPHVPAPTPAFQKDTSAPAVEEKPASVRKTRAPTWPYGGQGFRAGAMPVGDIGEILHYERGMDADVAAALEQQVLKAVAKDPGFVLTDIRNLRFIGPDLPWDLLTAIRGAVVFECDCVIEDIRIRQARGDVTALGWIDPKDSIFDAADFFS